MGGGAASSWGGCPASDPCPCHHTAAPSLAAASCPTGGPGPGPGPRQAATLARQELSCGSFWHVCLRHGGGPRTPTACPATTEGPANWLRLLWCPPPAGRRSHGCHPGLGLHGQPDDRALLPPHVAPGGCHPWPARMGVVLLGERERQMSQAPDARKKPRKESRGILLIRGMWECAAEGTDVQMVPC